MKNKCSIIQKIFLLKARPRQIIIKYFIWSHQRRQCGEISLAGLGPVGAEFLTLSVRSGAGIPSELTHKHYHNRLYTYVNVGDIINLLLTPTRHKCLRTIQECTNLSTCKKARASKWNVFMRKLEDPQDISCIWYLMLCIRPLVVFLFTFHKCVQTSRCLKETQFKNSIQKLKYCSAACKLSNDGCDPLRNV